MNRIKFLDGNTSNKIAAGEVVERPFSVVKELIENSIDAGSRNITIDITEGGEKSILIVDDGNGIYPDDIELAFKTHATSKIEKLEDIYQINSMGFRGEALASIAAVSKTKLISRTAEFDYGREILINGGYVDYIKDQGANKGTKIEVDDLFYNVPARLKFLKSPQRESALISDIVSRYSVSYPEISFTLISNSRKVIETYGNGNREDAILSIYGKSIRENLFSFNQDFGDYSVFGYLGSEELFRGSRNNQSIFINNRYIKNKTIDAAAENAFKSFITINKFPFFIIFIKINPELIDVNVHPTKSEIKFWDEREIYRGVFDSVHEAIRNSKINKFNDIPIDEIKEKTEEKKEYSIPEINKLQGSAEMKAPIYVNVPIDFTQEKKEDYIENNKIGERKLPQLRIIGQYHKTYIICEDNENLYLIDQHAAHEKILYEKYMKEIKNEDVAVQVLLSGIVIELSYEDFIIYKENKDIFENSGFKIEVFGENTIKISEAPIFIGKVQLEGFFKDMLDNISSMGHGDREEIKWRKIATMACKAAVKANDSLSLDEIKKLIDDLSYIDDPFNCPHGRPTIIKFSLSDMEKKFKRIE
ncbi:MAG: DNA mismatch repair endonuclease MutL [Clostridiaceae bacterium]